MWWWWWFRRWLKTDARGRYQITTVRPGTYPHEAIPAHIHFYVQAPSQRQCYYLSDFVFAGDPLLTDSYWAKLEQSDGFPRYGGVVLTRQRDTLMGRRDIHLLPQFDRRPTQSGLPVGHDCPSFEPWHAWGPDQGTRTCPMCAYGSGEGVLIWTRSVASDTLTRLARFWEARLRQRGTRPLRAFIVFTNPRRRPAAEVRALLQRFARRAALREVAVLYVAAPDDKGSAFLYQINPEVATTVLGYKQRQVVSRFINPGATEREMTTQLNSLK